MYFELKEGWHIYAKDPGDAGLPTKVTWNGPFGVSFGTLYWPKSRQFLDPGNIKTFGYTGSVLLSSNLTYHTWRDVYSEIPVHASVEWLACKDICVPGTAQLDLKLPITSTPPILSSHAQLFKESHLSP